jgi:hypothetical protein
VWCVTAEGNAAERQKAFAQFVSSRDKLVQPVFWKVWRGDDARERYASNPPPVLPFEVL